MIYGSIKSGLISLTFLVGFMPRLIAGIFYPGATENSLNPANTNLQIQLTKFFGLLLLISLLFIHLEDFNHKKLYLNKKLFFLFPFLAVTLLQSFKRDSFILQTALQIMLYLVLFAGSHSGGWKIITNLKFIVFFALSSELLIAVIMGSSAWRPCRTDKCLIPTQSVFVGQFSTGNSASVLFGFLGVVSLVAFRNRVRFLLLILFFIMTILSGGRSPLISFLACLCLSVIDYSAIRKMILSTVLLFSFAPIFFSFPDNFLTFRGYLWNSTRDFLLNNNGYASSITFTNFVQSSLSYVPRTTEAPHNLWLGIWWDSGFIGIILFLPILLSLLLQLSNLNGNFFVLLLYFMTLNITEPISSFYHFDSYSWILLVILLFWSGTRRTARPDQ